MKIHNLALTKHLQGKQFQLEIVSTISDYRPNFLIRMEVLKMFFKHPPSLSEVIYQFICQYNLLHWETNYQFQQINLYVLIYHITVGDQIKC